MALQLARCISIQKNQEQRLQRANIARELSHDINNLIVVHVAMAANIITSTDCKKLIGKLERRVKLLGDKSRTCLEPDIWKN